MMTLNKEGQGYTLQMTKEDFAHLISDLQYLKIEIDCDDRHLKELAAFGDNLRKGFAHLNGSV